MKLKISKIETQILILLLLCIPGCDRGTNAAPENAETAEIINNHEPGFLFRDVTADAGLHFVHHHGGTGRHYYIETMGPGCAFLDYDRDGALDIFLVQGGRLPGFEPNELLTHCLYRNLGDGRFEDVTEQAGLKWEHYGVGCCTGDYDNDDDTDIVVTGLYENLILENRGNGTFHRRSILSEPDQVSMSTSPAFVDVDHDGNLDLFICRYMDYDIQTNPVCKNAEGRPAYCSPNVYEGTTSRLYRGDGHGGFADISEQAQILSVTARAMGLAAADFNQDGLIDLYVSSDMMPNLFFVNKGDLQFQEQGVLLGAAYSSNGVAYAGMGVDCGDYDNDGLIDLVVTNFENEPNTLFHNEGDGTFFRESSKQTRLSLHSMPFLSWGVRFADLDLDGWQDLFVASGHVNDYDHRHAQPCQVYRNIEGASFSDVSAWSGEVFQQRQVARGAAFGDYDNDGDIDVLVASNNQPVKLLRNDTIRESNVLRLQLKGSGCNREGIGATVRVHGEPKQTALVRSGGSYLSDHDRRLVFGIGKSDSVDVEICWPCGNRQLLKLAAGKMNEVTETGCRCRKH